MDTRSGNILSTELANRLVDSERKFFKMMAIGPTEKQLARKPPKVGRNEPCPCGSGKKFKKCCLISVR